MISKDWIIENTEIIILVIILASIIITISIVKFIIKIIKYGFSNYFSSNGILYGAKEAKRIKDEMNE